MTLRMKRRICEIAWDFARRHHVDVIVSSDRNGNIRYDWTNNVYPLAPTESIVMEIRSNGKIKFHDPRYRVLLRHTGKSSYTH